MLCEKASVKISFFVISCVDGTKFPFNLWSSLGKISDALWVYACEWTWMKKKSDMKVRSDLKTVMVHSHLQGTLALSYYALNMHPDLPKAIKRSFRNLCKTN